MTGTVRLLTQDERKALEPIEKSHGITFSGGSCVTENGKDTFWLNFDARMATFGTALGQKVKDVLKADELILSGPGYQEVLE